MIFGGIDLGKYLTVTAVTRPLTPKVRLDETAVPGMDGAHVRDSGLEPVEISVDCNIIGGTVADVAAVRDAIAAALCGGERKLVLDDAPGRYVMARYKGGSEQSRNAHMPGLTLEFYCADPAAYGQHRTEQVTATQRPVSAGGNYRARPTVTCRPPAGSSWTLTNVTTGRYVRVEAPFSGSQTVVLDMRSERCTVNGADWPVTVESDFFALSGTQNIKTSGGTATLEWEERWL